MTEQRDFAKDREICNAATPGPWVSNSYNAIHAQPMADRFYQFMNEWEKAGQPSMKGGDGSWYDRYYDALVEVCNVPAHHGDTATERHALDMYFIATARTGWPAALDEIERLKAERESIRRMLSRVVRLLDVHTGSHDEIHEAYWLLSDYLEFGDLPNE